MLPLQVNKDASSPSEADANVNMSTNMQDADPTQQPPSSGSSQAPGPIFTPAPPSDVGGTSNSSVSNHSEAEPSSLSDIAIIGMSLRVPGQGNTSPDALWHYLLEKHCAASSMPPERWEPYHSRHPLNKSILSKTTSKGYFLDNLPDFDASFFGISPREAEQMDPQQRLALELAWEALEDAGIAPDKVAISGPENTTSVYMGVNSDDYGKLVLEDLANIGAHMGVGTAYCGVPSRISHNLNLMGPSLAVDAACASSLVAVHMARQAILAGETEVAIVGGVNALIGPGLTRVLDEAGAIASDGICRSFDDSAHGYGRGEGAGVVVLKKLDKALADGDRVHAVLKGSAVCGDGKTLGIMAPNAAAQRLVARKALKEAKLSAESIGYVEAHATSTPLGDPTEMSALAEVYGSMSRPEGAPCYVGSIKPNIGHLEAAAGVLGLIKSVLVLKHGVVPGQTNLEKHSTKIDWNSHKLVVPKEPTRLGEWTRPMRAAVASYGYSGTVSHAIVEASPVEETNLVSDSDKASEVLLFLSAPQANRLPAAAKALAQYLQTAPESVTLEQVATTLASRRNHHKYRTSVTAGTREEAIAALNKLANSEEDPYVVGTNASQHRVSPETAKKGVMWIFSGHGAQWPGMGKELMATQPLFAQTIHRLEPVVQRELGFSVVQALQSAREDHSTDENQIMTYAMHIGLATVLIEESGPPAAVVGHSLGETAAAVISGALSFEEGAILACTRARLYRRVMGTGGMALVSISAAEMRAKLAVREDKGIDVAIEASPTSCVIAGPKEPVMEMVGELTAAGVKLFPLPTDIGFHSRSLQQLAQPLREALEPVLHPKVPTTARLYSSWIADARSAHPRNAEYWVNNMVQPVLLHGAIKAIAEDGYRAFVEVSSHPIAAYSMSEILEVAGVSDAVVLPSMIRGKPAMKQLLTTVGRLHCLGYPVNYTSKNDRKPWATDVPRTIWSHVPYWREVSRTPKGLQAAAHDPNSNNLLGSKTTISGTKAGHVLFQTTIDETTKPFPGNHPLHGSEIVPAAVLVNTFLHAIDASAYCLDGVSLKVPVVVSPAREIQILLEEGKSLTLTSRLSESDGNGAWLVNTTSGIAPTSTSPRTVDLSEIKARMTSALPSAFSTDYLAKVGVPEMGFPWAIEEHFTDNSNDSTEMLALVATNPNNSINSGLEDLGASIMDAATSIASTIFHKDALLRMPTSIGKVTLPGGRYPVDIQKGYIHCTRTKMTKTEFIVDVTVLSETGDVVVEFDSMAFAGIEPPSKTETRRSENATDLVHRVSWLPATPSETPLSFSKVILFSPGEHSVTVEHSVTMRDLTRVFSSRGYTTIQTANPKDLATFTRDIERSIVIHVPRPAESRTTEAISQAAAKACEGLVSAVQTLSGSETTNTKLVSLILRSNNPNDSLAFSPLHGLSRIMKSEMPDIFAGLFDLESLDNLPSLPTTLKYIQNADIVRYQDYVPRVARLRPLICPAAKPTVKKTEFSPGGTYLITGGLGALGLQVAKWMAERGARRLVLLSRRALPPRSSWPSILSDTSAPLHEAISTITNLESQGCTMHPLALDLTAPSFPSLFTESLASGVLSTLPPINGIIHAAGVLIDQPIPEITTPEFNTVLSPKITGALHLHSLFPVSTPNLEFFIMFSSCGQLLGFPGQGSYASGNAFLDGLAELRRSQGDTGARSILWTSWRDLGMAGGSTNADIKLSEEEAKAKKDYISAELTSRGVGDVTPEEAFAAWDVITSAEDHPDGAESNVVVLKALEVEADEEAAVPILEEIAPRKERVVVTSMAGTGAEQGAGAASAAAGRPASGPELEKYLRETLTTTVANTLGLSAENVDASVALAEMGMDSVMTVAFRTTVQKKLKVKMAPTLVWKCPTIGHLVTYFMGELSA